MRSARGDRYWVDAGDFACPPLSRVTFEVGNERLRGVVFVAPERFLEPPVTLQGHLLGVEVAPAPTAACGDLPGADLPGLGTRLASGMVVGIDAAGRTVTVRSDSGEDMCVPAGNEPAGPGETGAE